MGGVNARGVFSFFSSVFTRTTTYAKDPYWSSLCRTVTRRADLVLEQGNNMRRKEWERRIIKNRLQPSFSILPALLGMGEMGEEEAEELGIRTETD